MCFSLFTGSIVEFEGSTFFLCCNGVSSLAVNWKCFVVKEYRKYSLIQHKRS